MLFGCGRFGDFAGDPLKWVTREIIVWVTESKEQLKAIWSAAPALPGSSEWYTYQNGTVIERGATPPETFTVPTPGTVPALAAAGVAAGVGDSNYDPLGGLSLANLVTLKVAFRHTLRGQFRQEDTSIELYELYRGVNAEPDLAAAPWQTSATLPILTAALAAGNTYKFVLMKRNRHNLLSGNNKSTVIVINGSGNQEHLPDDPIEQLIEPAAAGAARITASYDYLVDVFWGIAADTWAVWLTSNGVAPDPNVDPPTYTETMKFADGECKLDYTSAGVAHGSTFKAIVRTRRAGTPNIDSVNSTIMTATADANGPAAPEGSGAFFGEVAKQG